MRSNSIRACWRPAIVLFTSLSAVCCGVFTPKPGTVISESDVRQVTKDGVTVSLFGYVKQGAGEYYDDYFINCRLDQADFSTYDTLRVEIGQPQHSSIQQEFDDTDLNRWKTCHSGSAMNIKINILVGTYTYIRGVRREGCAARPDGIRLANGNIAFGTVCGEQVREGVEVTPDGRFSLCRIIDDNEPYAQLAPQRRVLQSANERTRCVETDPAGKAHKVRHYYKNMHPREVREIHAEWHGGKVASGDSQLDGPQLTYAENGGIRYSYYDEGKLNQNYEAHVAHKTRSSLVEHRGEREDLAKKHDSIIEPVEQALMEVRSADSALSRVRKMYSDGDPLKYCGCVWRGCLTLESPEWRNRSTAEKAAIKQRSKARDAMCLALAGAGLIEVSTFGSATLASGVDAMTIEAALASGDFSGIDVGGVGGDLMREAQQQFREADRLASEAKVLRAAERREMEALRAEQAREAEEAAEQAIQKERRRLAELGIKAKADLDAFRACTQRHGLDWDRRAEWQVVPEC